MTTSSFLHCFTENLEVRKFTEAYIYIIERQRAVDETNFGSGASSPSTLTSIFFREKEAEDKPSPVRSCLRSPVKASRKKNLPTCIHSQNRFVQIGRSLTRAAHSPRDHAP